MSKPSNQRQLQQILIRRHLKQLHQMQKQVRSAISSLKTEDDATEVDLHRLVVFKRYFARGRGNSLHQRVDDFKDEGDRLYWIAFCDKRRNICKETWELINVALYCYYMSHAKSKLPIYRLN